MNDNSDYVTITVIEKIWFPVTSAEFWLGQSRVVGMQQPILTL